MTTAVYNELMAKKKESSDRHLSNFMVRLPDIYRKKIEAIQKQSYEKNGFAPDYTSTVKLAINTLLKAMNIDPVDESPK